ncbi:MAG: hypothetical protein BGO21_22105 [Dyadobacter sp. 50-39]|nr:MAG: hypothetical protein BGO21_22105 [Dyadobacter sp. 50-39]
MILVDLLVILFIGVILFLFASHLETVKQNASHHRPAHFYRSRHSVESALDGVLSRYNQGFLSEKQYRD